MSCVQQNYYVGQTKIVHVKPHQQMKMIQLAEVLVTYDEVLKSGRRDSEVFEHSPTLDSMLKSQLTSLYHEG